MLGGSGKRRIVIVLLFATLSVGNVRYQSQIVEELINNSNSRNGPQKKGLRRHNSTSITGGDNETVHHTGLPSNANTKIVESKNTVAKESPASTDTSGAQMNCSENGSLHQIAVDMLNHSSPPGSPSNKKLQHVLDQNLQFYINLGPPIFSSIQESLSDMLKGYGLQRTMEPPLKNQTNVTLVETIFTPDSVCSIKDIACQNQTRVHIQSEQYATVLRGLENLKGYLANCHNSPNCIILEFSDHNYRMAKNDKDMGFGDSLVLMPVMHQIPSRISSFEVPNITDMIDLKERSYDIVFFGSMTERRKVLLAASDAYLETHPNKTNCVTKAQPTETQMMSIAYKNAKVCLVAHSYSEVAGGEYHRLSEFAGFGCIPVMEEFADTIGIEPYKKCGRVVFAKLDNLFETASNVIELIDEGVYDNDFSHVDWWRAGIQWDNLLSYILTVPALANSTAG